MAGYLCLKFIDSNGEVEANKLTRDGRDDAQYQCEQMIIRLKELDDEEDAIDAAEVERLYAEAEHTKPVAERREYKA